jgi:hypothetical protein
LTTFLLVNYRGTGTVQYRTIMIMLCDMVTTVVLCNLLTYVLKLLY